MLKRITDKLDRLKIELHHIIYNRNFRSKGNGVYLGRYVRIDSPDCVSLGHDVHIGDFTWISIPKETYQKGYPNKELRPRLSIDDGTYIGRFTTISCIGEINIGEKVMFSDRCYIGDCYHGYSDKNLAIIDQYLYSPGPIQVGDGSWIGINVSVMPNVKIGKHCVIGANSVVNINIPDYHIAAGNPVKIIRAIDFPSEKETQ